MKPPDGCETAGLPPSPRMMNRIAWACRWRNRVRSVTTAEEVVRCAAGDPLQLGRAHRTLAWHAKWRGDFKLAGTLASTALRHLKGLAAHESAAGAHAILGVVHFSRVRFDLARKSVASGYRELEHEDDTDARIELLTTEATLLRHLGQIPRAIDCLARAATLATGGIRARVFHNLARTHLDDDEVEAAEAYALPSVLLSKRHGNEVVYPYALEVLGATHLRAGRYDRARSCFEIGARAARSGGDRRAECQLLREAGGLALATYEAGEAISILRKGKAIAEELGYDLWQTHFCRDLARAYEMSGDLLGALHSMRSLDRLQARVRA